MKKITFLFLLLTSLIGFSQTGVTTVPAVPVVSNDIILKFDKTGTPLEDTAAIYAHIGVTVDGNRWKGVIADWAVNVEKNTFVNTSGNLYELNLGNLHDYFGIDPSGVISEICLVIRNSTGAIKSESDDVFLPIFPAGLNIQVTSPTNSTVFTQGETTTITADASEEAKLDLYINNDLIASEENVKTTSKSYTFSSVGDVTIKVVATTATETKEHEVSVYIPQNNIIETRPSELKHGITKHANGDISFMLFATNKIGIMLLGDFNDWTFSSDYQMKKDGDYYWLTIPSDKLDANTEYAYQYAVDFNKRFADPYSEKVLDPDQDKWLNDTQYPNLKPYPFDKTTGLASSFIINENDYNWQTPNFVRPNKDNVVIYELHLRDFTTEGTLNAAYEKLNYLADLGITAIELMPVNEFEGNNSWGYNPSFYFALDKAYGTKYDLKRFVDGCHSRGISVVLDVVFNHTFGQSPLVQMYEFSYNDGGTTTDNPYYADKHNFKEPGMRFGLKINHESEHTQRWIKDAISYWVNEYHIDGYRLDLTKGFTNQEFPVGDYGSAYTQERVDRLTDYANYTHTNHGADFIFSCEHLSDNSEEKVLAENGMMLWGNLNHNYSEAVMGYNTGTKSDLNWGYYKNRSWTNKNLITYMESHDEERLMRKALEYGNSSSDGTYTIKDTITALKRVELASAFFLTLPGPKLIWQFGELGYDYGINYCPDGTYGDCRVDLKPVKWEYAYDDNRTKLFDIMSKLNILKSRHPETFNSNSINMDVTGAGKRINLYDESQDSYEGLHAVSLGNFDVKPLDIEPNFPYTGTWYEYFTGETIDVTEIGTGTLTLEAGEYRLYTTKPPESLSINDLELMHSKSSSIALYPNPSSGLIHFTTDITEATIMDITGKTLATYNSGTIVNNTISIADLSKGIYLVQVIDKNKEVNTLRFVKE